MQGLHVLLDVLTLVLVLEPERLVLHDLLLLGQLRLRRGGLLRRHPAPRLRFGCREGRVGSGPRVGGGRRWERQRGGGGFRGFGAACEVGEGGGGGRRKFLETVVVTWRWGTGGIGYWAAW